ncbi:MAG: oligosaccharide flippase family protein [Hoeflea sp. D1-CHI-28]
MVRSVRIVGSASVLNVILGVVRLKIFALLLGPAGVGLAGLYTNLMTLSATVSGLGIGSSGLRQVASMKHDPSRRGAILSALWFAGLTLGAFGGAATYFLREILAVHVLGDIQYASGVAWTGIGVAASVIGVVFCAIPQGLQRLGDFARINVIGNSIGSLGAVAIIWQFGASGIPYAVICLPLGVAIAAAVTVGRLVRSELTYPVESLCKEIAPVLRFGITMLFTSILSIGTVMAARVIIADRLGLDVAGYFHAARIISATYMAFLLSAMATDFYPRVTATVAAGSDPASLIRDQMHFGVVLASPLVVGVIAFASPIILLLYSAEFSASATILQIQLLGDLLKVMSFPLGFTLLALGKSWKFLSTEVMWNLVYLCILLLGLERFGIAVVGVAYLASYAANLTLTFFMVRHSIGFRPNGKLKWTAAISIALAVAVSMLALFASATVGYIGGALAICVLGAYTAHVVIPEVATREYMRPLIRITKTLRSKFLDDK